MNTPITIPVGFAKKTVTRKQVWESLLTLKPDKMTDAFLLIDAVVSDWSKRVAAQANEPSSPAAGGGSGGAQGGRHD